MAKKKVTRPKPPGREETETEAAALDEAGIGTVEEVQTATDQAGEGDVSPETATAPPPAATSDDKPPEKPPSIEYFGGQVGLNQADIDALKSEGIDDVQKLMGFRESPEQELTSINGIGDEAAAKIINALDGPPDSEETEVAPPPPLPNYFLIELDFSPTKVVFGDGDTLDERQRDAFERYKRSCSILNTKHNPTIKPVVDEAAIKTSDEMVHSNI